MEISLLAQLISRFVSGAVEIEAAPSDNKVLLNASSLIIRKSANNGRVCFFKNLHDYFN